MMRIDGRIQIGALAAVAASMTLTLVLAQKQEDSAAQENADRAIRILRSACDHLAGAKSLRVTNESTHDEISPDGIRMELSARRKILLQRPDRVRIDTEGDAGSRTVVFDRGRLGVMSPSDKVYGELELPPTLDKAIDKLANEYGMVLPTADLMLSDPYQALTGSAQFAAYLGEHAAAGKPCHHLAFQTQNVDFQVWVDKAEQPVFRKLVVTYKNEPGVPQYRALFHDWEFNVEPPAAAFAFKPPSDFLRMDFEPKPGKPQTQPGEK